MNRSPRRSPRLAAWLALALLATVVPPAVAATSSVHFQSESYSDFQKQLAHGEIHAATFNKKAHSIHLVLNDGRHMKASYPSHDEPRIAAAIRAKGVSVKVVEHKPPAVHHTLRYIAGGILVIVILAILAVLLIGRRRNLADGESGESGGTAGSGEASAAPPAPSTE